MPEKAALIVVDVQNDFCPGGALAVPDGDRVVPVVNEYIRRFQAAGLPVIATRDWHPQQTRHFASGGGVWPEHCIQDTPGAAFHPGLQLPANAVVITKGADPQDDSYSGFDGVTPDGEQLAGVLRRLGVDHIYVGGLATDYCVKFTALDAARHGLKITVLKDASRGVEVQPGDTQRALDEMCAAGAALGTLETVTLDAASVG